MRVIGLMSGTSMDAIDAAVIDVAREADNLHVDLRAFVKVPYPAQTLVDLNALLESGLVPKSRAVAADVISSLASLNAAVGEAFADAANLARKEVGGGADLVGSHGQTICHQPRPGKGLGLHASTMQIGEAAVIAQRTGLTTVADFRVADLAAGGEGAPLVSFVDFMLLRSSDQTRVALNIGGIANVTLLPAGCNASQVSAFDTGPGNMPLDLAVRRLFPDGPGFDRNGQIAARGHVSDPLLEWLLADPYFARRPPKTTGREQFGADFVERAWVQAQSLDCTREDVIATLTELTARSIAAALPDDCGLVIAAGGGVHNKSLMARLERELKGSAGKPALSLSDAYGLPADAKEAIAFAVLAFEAVHGRPNQLPSATGAIQPAVLGKICPGANFVALMRSIWT